ncbi:MAG TPA: endolytic transglycosylase MltG [Lentimicrobium sp.]|nr:endolytic transglycosylase MltG [Lentimicrobium sp.]
MRESYHPGYGSKRTKKTSRKKLWLFLLLLIIAGVAYYAYSLLYARNVYVPQKAEAYIDIPTGSNFDSVKKILYSKGFIVHRNNFELVADLKKYQNSVKPGHYKLNEKMSNLDLVNKLRSGAQDPVNVIFNNVRFSADLAGVISHQIEADSVELENLMHDTAFLDSLGVSPLSLFTIMIPNTYEFYWTTNPRAFFKRMKEESEKFWANNRDSKLSELSLNRHQVITLASIIEKETNMNDEKARVAGVYLNRLRQGWLLEADPTLVFAHGNFGIKRVLNIYKEIDSPYNTYKYTGLPPGPICLPSVSSIDAVLNHENHKYMFFCAKEDFSGYHAFAETIEQHNVNAWKYQQALNQRKIMN